MVIEINDDLITQWEPKIQRLLANTFIYGWDKEDLEQELRIAILKAAKGFNADKGVIFHTYLHTAMVNTLRTLISKAQKRIITESLDVVNVETEMLNQKMVQAIAIPDIAPDYIEFNHLLTTIQVTPEEKQFIKLRLEGLTMEEISQELQESAYKVRHSLQNKWKARIDEEEA